MAVNIGQIKDSAIYLNPSGKLKKFLKNIKISDDIPVNIKNFVFKNKTKESISDNVNSENRKLQYLTTKEDIQFIKSLNLQSVTIKEFKSEEDPKLDPKESKLLKISDLHWLYGYIQRENKNNEEKVYLHELIDGSEVVLPKNLEIPRNEELEKRCKLLRIQQQNREYQKMTKNVDNVRKRLPEDTIAYQLKQLNRQMIAIAQFIITVLAGFAFGFIGLELIVGSLDFGFRLLLGIICALIIALAELYFLAKRLNEDLEFEYPAASTQNKTQKIVKQE